ncbi:MFS transporter [Pseudonocardia ailaonensis]|uniref:MFS transporter n=1 Tax=Pseudonocardia ailaonensis TaxID=367279 RepID=A0ABN2NFL8_9PSEU
MDNVVAVGPRLDRLPVTRKTRILVAVVGVGLFFDLYEVFLTGTLANALKRDFALDGSQVALVLASVWIGAFFGALSLSRVADRIGRRRAFFLTLAIYSVFSIVAAFSVNVEMLIICRFIAGIGIGAEPPLCDSYLSDMVPAAKRGRLTAWAYTFAFCAIPLTGLLAIHLGGGTLFGIDGWRIMFLLGGLGALVCWVLRTRLPESPRWLESVGRREEADRIVSEFEASAVAEGKTLAEVDTSVVVDERPSRFVELFSRPLRKRTTMMWIFHTLSTVVYYGFGTLAPLALAAKGFDVVQSAVFTTLIFVGYPIGSSLTVFIVDRVERRTLLFGSLLVLAVVGYLFGTSTSAPAIIAFGFVYTAVSNGFSNFFHIYQAEIYPTRLRATGAGSAYSLSRLTTAFMPFALLPLLYSGGATLMFTAIAATACVLAVVVRALGPRVTGAGLESINDEGPAADSVLTKEDTAR